jgi:hypothetical protein
MRTPKNPLRLKVVQRPTIATRTIFDQRDSTVPVFVGKDDEAPSLQCGRCNVILARDYFVFQEPPAIRMLPFPSGGEYSVLSISVETGEMIQSEGGPVVVKCAGCEAFNEMVLG